MQTIEEHNSAWRAWFASVLIQPHIVRYEDLDADPVGVACEVLDFLGLKLAPGRLIKTRNRRLADELNTLWINRYRAELAERLAMSSGLERANPYSGAGRSLTRPALMLRTELRQTGSRP